NHVSYVDALVLSAAVPRPVRWVMYHRICDVPGLNWIFRTARAIPIAGAREDPELMQRAFDEIDAALAAGELVGIFPEGSLTKDGEIAPFKSGVERILARRPVPVVPLALRGLWASMWSPRASRLGRMRVPRRFRARVELVAGARLRPEGEAREIELRVRELRGDDVWARQAAQPASTTSASTASHRSRMRQARPMASRSSGISPMCTAIALPLTPSSM